MGAFFNCGASGLRQPESINHNSMRNFDGDKSPAESGENSPHSILDE